LCGKENVWILAHQNVWILAHPPSSPPFAATMHCVALNPCLLCTRVRVWTVMWSKGRGTLAMLRFFASWWTGGGQHIGDHGRGGRPSVTLLSSMMMAQQEERALVMRRV
jgi:hypothetical protein